MQKILIIFLGLLLIGVFFFIQNSDEKKQKTHELPEMQKQEIQKVQNDIPAQEPVQAPKSTNISQTKKPFSPNITLDTTPEKVTTTEDIKALDSMSERERQKEIFADIQSRMTTEIQTIPSCLENAQTKKDAITCSKKLHNINKEFELLLGIEADTSVQENTSGFIWNEKTKENMIKELDASIEPMQEMFICIQSADSDEEQEKCFTIDEIK